MKIWNLFIIFFGLIFVGIHAHSQQFGGNPASLKWRQINTDTIRLIFPAGLEKKASEVASIIHQLPDYSASSLGNQFKKINIVLQNQTILSNGYVGMGPYRSEFQLTPLQNSFRLGSLPWHLTLSLHEYRHIQQYNNFRTGIAKAFYVTLGEEAGALLNNIAIPDWFWEGDAVLQETFFTKQGRGRIPYFFNDFQAIRAAQKDYSWMKLRNGSLRDLVPDHYTLGYMMVAYGREKYGADTWKKITQDAASFKGLFYPLQGAVKRHTGIGYPLFRKKAMEYFDSSSTSEMINDPVAVRKARNFIGDEEFPQWIDTNHVVYVRNSFNRVPAFVSRNIAWDKEKIIRLKDISIDNYFSYRNGKIVYAAYLPDTRWGWKNYSDLRIIDIATGSQLQLTRGSKYFSPDIDPEGKKVVAASVDPFGMNALHILDAGSGNVLKILPNKENYFFTYPKFFDTSHIISAIRNSKGEMALAKIHSGTADIELLTPFSMTIIGFPSVTRDTIVFTASFKGIDRLFSIVGGQLYQLNSRHATNITGNYHGNVLNNKWVWTMATSAGFLLTVAPKSEIEFSPYDPTVFLNNTDPYDLSALKSPDVNLIDSANKRQYKISGYPKTFRLFNFHSLRPDISDPQYTLSIASENILNTFRSELAFTYNRNEGSKLFGFSGIYSAFFPWINAGIDYTMDRNARYRGNRIYWNEIQPRIGFSIPLNLTGGRNYRSLSFGTDYVYNKQYYKGIYKDSIDARGYSYLSSFIQWNSQVQKARQHIYPRYAQSVTISYRKAVTRYDNNQFLASSLFYFPGISRNHNIVLQAAFHQRDTGRVFFSNTFPFSRGYSADNFRRMIRLGANYHFPIVYPDLGFAHIIYFLRIRANAFYDYTRAFNETLQNDMLFRSLGGEIYFDTKWWNQHSVSFGFRYSRLLDTDFSGRSRNQWEFVLPVNLLGR